MFLKKRKLGRGVAVVGAGITKFGVYPAGVRATDLFLEAFTDLITSIDKGFNHEDIEALYLGNFSSDIFENQVHTAASLISRLGLTPRPAVRVEDACASSGAAFREGVIAIASGIYDMVLVGGMEKMTGLSTPEVTSTLSLALDPVVEAPAGLTFPGIFAAMTTAHMAKYGTTPQDLMRVAIKNHQNAALNPKAHLSLTIKDIMRRRAGSLTERGLPRPSWEDELDFLSDPQQNPVIAWPLRLYDCSTVCDGASCVLMVSGDIAREFTDKPVYVIGTGQASDDPLHERADMTAMRAVAEAAGQAYEMSGISPKDIDIAELHDCFTIAEIMAMEDLGFYPPGKAAQAVREGETGIHGNLSINTDGGLKAKGHPVGASGTGMIVELFKQMRGEAGSRQVKTHDLELGLMQNIGANGTTAVVNILQRK